MVFDFHTHTFPDAIAAAAISKLQAASHTRPFTNGTMDALRASMASAAIDRALVLPVATSARQVTRINDTAIAINDDAAQTGVYSLGCMHPDFDDWQTELSRLARAGVRGIKLHPIYQGVDFDDPRYLRILSRAAELDLFVIIHAGLDVGFPGVVHGSPRMVLRALEEVGPFKLILAHMGGWRCWDEVLNLLPGTGAYIDTSFSLGSMTPNGDGYYKKPEDLALLDEARFIRLIRAFGADRVLFGTDCPWSDQGAEFARFRALPLTKDEQEQILWKNAFALMKGQSESLAV